MKHNFNPREAEAGRSEFKFSLVYREGSRIGKVTQRNHVLKPISKASLTYLQANMLGFFPLLRFLFPNRPRFVSS